MNGPKVNRALPDLGLHALDLVIIENVGEHAKAMVYSVTEDEDKPLKYPVMFRSVDMLLLNMISVAHHLDVAVDSYIARAREVNAAATIRPVSARTGAGMGARFGWLPRFAEYPPA